MEKTYYFAVVKYKDSKGHTHANYFLAKASSKASAEEGIRADALNQGLEEENIISIEANEPLECD